MPRGRSHPVRAQKDVRRELEERQGVSAAESCESTNSRRPLMQGFGLPSDGIRNGRAAARLRAAKTPNIEAARRRATVGRWRRAMTDGLTVEQAARCRCSARHYRWEKKPEQKSRRPHHPRRRRWPGELGRAGEDLRRQSDLGQAQDRRAAPPRGPQGLDLDGWPHPRPARQARRHRPRAPSGPEARGQPPPPSCQGALRPPPAQGPQGQAPRRTRANRPALRQPKVRQANQALHRLRSGR